MTEIDTLQRRRELVMLSAELQRATIARRLSRIEANPARVALGYAAKVASRPLLITLGTRAVRLAVRAYRRRSVNKGRH
ncbi:MAG TPA: hypothetical protein VFJ86_03660 [Usitatibacter sp.]|jgi:hypothetical protein|nr:hypothetical protein [Usitatibacter sp.]